MQSPKGKSIKTNKKTLTILSISKSEKEIYTFEKEQGFLPFLFDLLLKLGFDKDSLDLQYFFGINHDDGNCAVGEVTEEEYYNDPYSKNYIDINLFKDKFENIENKDWDIEVIFFTSRIYFIVRKKTKNNINLSDIVSGYAFFKNEDH